MTRYRFTRISHNRKTGPIPVTTAARETCPPSCAFYDRGCYALAGPVTWHWRRLNGAGLTLAELCAEIKRLPGGTLWRHNQAGDLPGKGDALDAAALDRLAKANQGRRGFTYTHKPDTPANVAAMKRATAAGFTINLSADNVAHADQLARHGLPVAVVIPADAPKVSRTPRGRKVVLCPAESSEKITCSNCGLCAIADRDYLIGFKPKGRAKHAVDSIAKETTS